MRIVEPYAKMIGDDSDCVIDISSLNESHVVFDRTLGIKKLRRVERAARISHRSEDRQTMDSWDRFLRSVVLQHGDWSVTEHEKVSVDILVDRGITHELVRHRIASYTQESTRFVNPIKKDGECKFIMPCTFETDAQGGIWTTAMANAEKDYMRLLEAGCAPQIARSVLPNALASRIIVTMNLRGWRHFLIMRTTRQAHPQMRQVTLPLLQEFQACVPILYEDIEPMQDQASAIARAR